MFSRKYIKQNKLKRLILKLLNVYAYDKETLRILNPDFNENDGNLVDFNNKSFNFSLGYLDLKRKINKLDIFFRYSPQNNLWNSTDRWKRIIPNIDKKTLISVCLLSLIDSIKFFSNDNKIDISVNLIADNSTKEFDKQLLKTLESVNIKSTLYTSKVEGNRGSYLECCDQAENSDDLIFFVEDDYLFEKNCIDEMLITFSRISSILSDDIIICPTDYPFYYDALYKTSLFIGKNLRWRNVQETLLTFMFSRKILDKYKDKIRKVGETTNDPFEKPLHEIYKEQICLAPVTTLSHHLSRSVPSINEDWISTWNYYFTKLKKSNF